MLCHGSTWLSIFHVPEDNRCLPPSLKHHIQEILFFFFLLVPSFSSVYMLAKVLVPKLPLRRNQLFNLNIHNNNCPSNGNFALLFPPSLEHAIPNNEICS
ncbi:hypothetical protein HS088_TW02G00518 [Tripterygium wilfordii]|uniref:Uncharacterized protein n=1 Tax=Tripterygium wilfordii TaxID=458696 RepID=A0A7J7DZ84_TRIWF|nr:hypothetical protein HS088_TW02G00518 [Tripterygium wilfordii]